MSKVNYTCESPVYLYQDIVDSQGVIRHSKIGVPCGKCISCLIHKRSGWLTRLIHEYRNCNSAHFVTLTYDQEHLPFANFCGKLLPVLCKSDIQKFFKRLRRRLEPFKVRYYLAAEYGPLTERPHYHFILFDFPKVLQNKLYEFIEKAWGLGFVSISDVNDSRIKYVASYLFVSSLLDKNDPRPRPFMLCSRRPAIGHSYYENASIVDWHREDLSRTFVPDCNDHGQFKRTMPRLYKTKIYDRAERQWQAMLNRCANPFWDDDLCMFIGNRDYFEVERGKWTKDRSEIKDYIDKIHKIREDFYKNLKINRKRHI